MPAQLPGRAAVTGFARDLDLLEALADAVNRTGAGLRLIDLAEVTGRERSQVSRALGRLEAAGLVERDGETRQFALGWRLYHLAGLTGDARLVRQTRPALRRIMLSIGETTHLCVLRGTVVVTLHSETPAHGYRGMGWMGVEAAAHLLTAGRVLLAEWDEAALRTAYPKPTLPDVPASAQVRTVDQLIEECATIRRKGYAVVDEGFELGLVGASAPVRDFRGVGIASINVAAPKLRLGTKLDALGQRLAREAWDLSVTLGWHPPGHPTTAKG